MSITFTHVHLPVSRGSVHIVEAGNPAAPPVVLLHGWPQDWSAWSSIMKSAAATHRAIALDLPGIGLSTLDSPNGEKAFLADLVHEVVEDRGLRDITLVGHDAGGMVAYSYARRFPVRRLVIMDTVIPGIEPWSTVLANPYVWHFAFHAVPELPERLVAHERESYFNYFYQAISAHPEAITPEARKRYVAAYSGEQSLRQGFELYRAFSRDAKANGALVTPVATPLLYLRGSSEGGDIAEYARGFAQVGMRDVTTSVMPDAGHFAPEEAPDAVWKAIMAFSSSGDN